MYQVRIDPEKNRLYLTLSEVYRQEAKELYERLESECKQLKPGFTCITDLRRQKKPIGRVDQLIYSIQKLLANSGMRKVVRIVTPGAEEIELQFENISTLKVGYSAYTTTSMKIAEEILDKEK